MDNWVRFIKRQWMVIAGVIGVAVLGVFYLVGRSPAQETLTAGAKTVTIFDASAGNTEAEGVESSSVEPSGSEIPTPEKSNTIKVYITGAVTNPGVYELETGARVDDVLQMAGGETETADMLRVNLAAYVTDAERVIIPEIGGPDPAEYADADTGNDETDTYTNAARLININTASQAALDTLPGIGPVIAQSIIDYRNTNGGFTSIEEIMEVSRIGSSVFEQIKDKITVE
jgi:competence protein ComEA